MKKLFSIVLAASFLLCLSVPAFAEFKPTDGTNNTIDVPAAAEDHTVPMYGYVGPDALIIDDPPDDPDAPPTVILGVSIPVKLLWAAFESDGGDITSPNYFIQNNSEFDVKITVKSLAIAASNADHTAVDNKLILTFKGFSDTTFSDVDVWKGSARGGTGAIVGEVIKLAETEKRPFTVGGSVTADLLDGEVYQNLKYNLVLTIEKDV